MIEQTQADESNTGKEQKDLQKNRTKAAFSLLNHFVKIYNDTETYVKRALTLFGLGSIIAGFSFSCGQYLSGNKVTLPQNSSNTSTSTSQQPVHPTPQPNPPQPQIIYVTPAPTQPIIFSRSQTY